MNISHKIGYIFLLSTLPIFSGLSYYFHYRQYGPPSWKRMVDKAKKKSPEFWALSISWLLIFIAMMLLFGVKND